MMEKKCAKCKQTLPISNFYKSKRSYARSRCKSCEKSDYPTLERCYGLTQQDWDSMFERQGRKCSICQTTSPTRWHVDHDHNCCPGRRTCGQCVRGILCLSCNTKTGWFERNRAALERYLECRD